MNKKLIGISILVSSLLMYNTDSHVVNSNQRPPDEVLDTAWVKFGLYSYGIGKTYPVNSIGMDKTKSKT
ncbi:hypothetical protein [Bacillus atrophaeus]|uniref:hypothetical protein n=1 Tax=Bacillus atrophaeus TaxID=1452 RepID=UPI00398A5A34